MILDLYDAFGISIAVNAILLLIILYYRGSYLDENKWKCAAFDRENDLKKEIWEIKGILSDNGLQIKDTSKILVKINKK